jgi:hypothetical protein
VAWRAFDVLFITSAWIWFPIFYLVLLLWFCLCMCLLEASRTRWSLNCFAKWLTD